VSEVGAPVPNGPWINIKLADVPGFDFSAPL
jgi:hypothetical protein